MSHETKRHTQCPGKQAQSTYYIDLTMSTTAAAFNLQWCVASFWRQCRYGTSDTASTSTGWHFPFGAICICSV